MTQLERDKARILARRERIDPYLSRVKAAAGSSLSGSRRSGAPMTTDQAAADVLRIGGASVSPRGRVYRTGGPHSFIRDVAKAKTNTESAERLRIHALEDRDELRRRQQDADAGIRAAGFEVERRTLNTTAGQGGEFSPPMTLLDAWSPVARAGRVFADGMHKEALPTGISSITVPRATTGSTVAIQTANNAAVSSTDLVTTSIACPVATVAGSIDTSLQLLEQTAPQFQDTVLIADLLADYSAKLDQQALNGTGANGQLTGWLQTAGLGNVVYTSATPTLVAAWPKIANARSQIGAARKLPATGIYLTPARWAWCLSQLDGNNSPMIREDFDDDDDAAGDPQNSGTMVHLPIFEDGNIPANAGVGANQDQILVTRLEDSWLWESQTFVRVLPNPLSGTFGVRVELYRFCAMTSARYSGSAAAGCTVSGTGLTAPTYA
jgi:HK97 family phage major capsid protein